MPIISGRRPRRRYRKKRAQTYAQKTVRKIAQKVVNSSKETKRTIVETGDEQSVSLLSTASNFLLTSVSQGDSSYTRNGDKIYAMNLKGSYIITNQNSFAAYVRVLIVSDKTQDVNVSTTEFFEGVNDTDMTISDARTAGFHVPLVAKINTQKCYAIYDRVHKIDPVMTRTNMYKYNVKLNRQMVYDGAESTTSKPLHRFRMVILGVDATNDEVSGSIEFSGQCHLFFKDM